MPRGDPERVARGRLGRLSRRPPAGTRPGPAAARRRVACAGPALRVRGARPPSAWRPAGCGRAAGAAPPNRVRSRRRRGRGPRRPRHPENARARAASMALQADRRDAAARPLVREAPSAARPWRENIAAERSTSCGSSGASARGERGQRAAHALARTPPGMERERLRILGSSRHELLGLGERFLRAPALLQQHDEPPPSRRARGPRGDADRVMALSEPQAPRESSRSGRTGPDGRD